MSTEAFYEFIYEILFAAVFIAGMAFNAWLCKQPRDERGRFKSKWNSRTH